MKWEYKRRYRLLGGKKILDVGFGSGVFLESAPENTKVFGIDINKTAVEAMKEKGFNVEINAANEIHLENESLDGVHCAHVIEHLTIDEVDDMLKEFYRILKPKGRILIATPHEKKIWRGPYHLRPYPPFAIKKLFNFHGFKLIKEESLGEFKGIGFFPQPLYYWIKKLISPVKSHEILVVGEKIG